MDGTTLFERGAEAEAAPGGRVFARVVVERGIESGRGEDGLTYRCDESAIPEAGDRVEVPLGKGGKRALGVVVRVGGPELLEGLSPSKVKAIIRRTGAKLPEELLSLAEWMSQYYVCPLGMVLATLVPAAVKRGTGASELEIVDLSGADPGALVLGRGAKKALSAIMSLGPGALPMEVRALAARLGVKSLRSLRELITAGALVRTVSSSVRAAAIPEFLGEGRAEDVTLTQEQRRVVDGVRAMGDGFRVHLVRGVTGSGKTEVYLRLLGAVLEAGKTGIVLVPEIALTPQTSARFTSRFGTGRVAVLHSGLTGAQRNREWTRAANGQARVVVGARSAVFAPLANVGIIIVDEEHDSSYKQDQLPRYNARDVAIKRGQMAGCAVVLGSATPSLESWANAAGGRANLWELNERANGSVLPRVEVVDMREERRRRAQVPGGDDGRLHLLGPTLEGALEDVLGNGGQAILLLNRRGFAHHLCCPHAACGFVVSCDQCDSTLVLHRYRLDREAGGRSSGELVRCHHCLSEQVVPRLCPSCGTKLNAFGGGTQRVEDELARKFGSMDLVEGKTLLRLDSDSMRSAKDYFGALSRFASGEVKVLLGTQMIAKGLDYPNVRLVGVIDADTSLAIPDFRAAERTFQLVSQVAGRAGRGTHPGRVIIQTMNPASAAIRLAAEHDYVSFAALEMGIRERAKMPPVTRMARVVCRDEVAEKAEGAAAGLASALRQTAEGAIVQGPFPCTVSRIAGQFRFGVDVIAPRAGVVQAGLRAARAAGLVKSDAKTAVDVDPVSLM